MTRSQGWKVAAAACSIALAGAFVAYRVASAKTSAGAPPPPATASPEPTTTVEPAPVEFMGGSKSLIGIDPRMKFEPSPTPVPPSPSK